MLVHGDNLRGKIDHRTKYRDDLSRTYLAEISEKYDAWNEGNVELVGPRAEETSEDIATIQERVALLRAYKDFLDEQRFAEKFDARSNLHSSVLEEFLYYLFRDLVESFGPYALIGKSHAFKDLFFVPPSYEDMLERPHAQVERKDHDFVIGATVEASFRPKQPEAVDTSASRGSSADESNVEVRGEHAGVDELAVVDPGSYDRVGVTGDSETVIFDVPAIAIECKTYLDKTMLEGSSRAAEEIKARNPNGLYLVVAERLKLSGAVNLKKYAVDQIYVLRQERNIDREYRLLPGYDGNPISDEVVAHLFHTVRQALTVDWSVGLDSGIERGWLL